MLYNIRQFNEDNWEEIKEIYLAGIQTGNATFQTEVPSREQWFEGHIKECNIGCFKDDEMLGWGAK